MASSPGQPADDTGIGIHAEDSAALPATELSEVQRNRARVARRARKLDAESSLHDDHDYVPESTNPHSEHTCVTAPRRS